MLRSRVSSLTRILGAVLALVAAPGCLADNYDDPEGPRFAGDYTDGEPAARDEVVIVTYNLKLGGEIDVAIAVLSGGPFAGADVIAMQEMSPDGVDRIARALSLRYVYYPSSIHQEGRDFGNAVLTPWPIVDDHKLVLPHSDPFTNRLRTATAATVALPGGDAAVYSVHTSIPTLGLGARLAQAQAVLDDAAATSPGAPLVIAGDFNTGDPSSPDQTVMLFEDAGLAWASRDVERTATRFGRDYLLDFVFVGGFAPRAAGVFDGDPGSDHWPVWAALARPAEAL